MKQTLEEAINEIGGVHPDWDKITCFRIGFKEGARWQKKQSPWISVKERLPDESEFVLCRMVSNEAIVGGYIFVSPDGLPCVATLPNFEFDDYGGYVCDMWMPIPKFN